MWEQHLESVLTLAQQYQLSKDREVLGEIFKRIEGLIVNAIVDLKKHIPYLQYLELNDLYQDSILCLTSFFLTVPSDFPINQMPTRIKSNILDYVKAKYRSSRREIPAIDCTVNVEDNDGSFVELLPCVSETLYENNDPIHKEAIEFYEEFFLVKCKRHLTKREFDCLHYYYFEDYSYDDIGRLYNIKKSRVSQIMNKALRKVRIVCEDYSLKI
jgi:RNA polymerase sigma factor (sigma-70 family)